MSKTRGLVIIGGREHSHVVAEAVSASGKKCKILGYVDNKKQDGNSQEYLGSDECITDILNMYPDARFIIGIGSNSIRRKVAQKHKSLEGRYATVIHPFSYISGNVSIGEGSYIGPGAVLMPNSKIGRHTIVNSGVIVEHDCCIGDYVHLAPSVTLGGGTSVGDHAFIGLGAKVIDHIVIGEDSIIGAGAVVIRDVHKGWKIVGVPAKQIN